MRLVGRHKLQQLLSDESICAWVHAWVAELSNANWRQAADVSNQFPNVRQFGANYFIFPINNCKREIHIQIAFPQGIAVVADLL